MNLWLQSRNKGPVIGLENSFVPMAKDSSIRSKQDKNIAEVFFNQNGAVRHKFTPAG